MSERSFTLEEDRLIIESYATWGDDCWGKVAQALGGRRSENAIRNHWVSLLASGQLSPELLNQIVVRQQQQQAAARRKHVQQQKLQEEEQMEMETLAALTALGEAAAEQRAHASSPAPTPSKQPMTPSQQNKKKKKQERPVAGWQLPNILCKKKYEDLQTLCKRIALATQTRPFWGSVAKDMYDVDTNIRDPLYVQAEENLQNQKQLKDKEENRGDEDMHTSVQTLRLKRKRTAEEVIQELRRRHASSSSS